MWPSCCSSSNFCTSSSRDFNRLRTVLFGRKIRPKRKMATSAKEKWHWQNLGKQLIHGDVFFFVPVKCTPLGWATEKNKLWKKRSSVTFSGSWMGLTVFFVYVILLEQEETLLNSLFFYVEDHPTQPMSIKWYGTSTVWFRKFRSLIQPWRITCLWCSFQNSKRYPPSKGSLLVNMVKI